MSYLDDPRFSAAGVLAPKMKANFAFLEGMVLWYTNIFSNGRITILLPHGRLFRGNVELKIRKYLIDELNVLDAVIGLLANLFHVISNLEYVQITDNIPCMNVA